MVFCKMDKMVKYFPLLKKNPLFSDIPSVRMKELLSGSCQLIELKKKQKIFEEGSTDDNIYILIQGIVKIYRKDNKKEIIDIFLRNEMPIVNIDYLFQKNKSTRTAECITSCVLLGFTRQAVYKCLSSLPNYFFKIGCSLLDIQELYSSHLRLLTSSSTIVEAYQRFACQYENMMRFLPNKDIASFLGISEEALTRVKNSLHFR